MANSVFANAIALDPGHVPETLQHRDGELDELRAALQPIADGLRPENAMLYGPSGTGKTTMAKRVVQSLEKSVLDFRWGYVDVMGSSSKRDVLYELARDLDVGRDLPREGIGSGRILDRIRECEDDLVLIVDELQFLSDPDVLGTLLEIPNSSTIGITLQQDEWLADLHPGVASRVRSATAVTLDPYGPDQLRDIVRHRIDVGLEPGIVADGTVETIAERASGDARFAIALLRRGARVVLSGEADQITPSVIDDVEEGAREAMLKRYREQLGTYKRLLYDIVAEAEEIRAENLHAEFEERCDDPPSRRQRQRYLEGLQTYGLIVGSGRGRGVTYEIP